MTALVARAGLPARATRVPGPAVPLAAAAVLTCLVGLLLLTRSGAWALPSVDEVPNDAAIALAYPLTALVVLAGPRTARPLGWLLLAVGVVSAAVVACTALAATATSATGAAVASAWLQGWLWVPGFLPLVTVLPLLYPDGGLLSPRWRPALVAAAVGTALLAVAVALHPEDFVGQVVLADPFPAEPVARVLLAPAVVLLVGSALAGVASLVVRLRRSTGLARRQVVVFLAAAAVLLAEAVVHGALPPTVAAVAQPAAIALLPLAVAVAVTRHRLYELDVAVLRALVGLSLAGCVAGGYLTLFALLRAALPEQQTTASAVAAGATGLLVVPLAARLSRAADRLYYGDRADPYAVLAALSARLREGVAVGDVPRAVCGAVVESLRLRAAQITVAGGARAVASVGEPGPVVETFALRHRGALVGQLAVSLRAGEQQLDARDRELLSALADQAAPAVDALRLLHDLQASREALVTSREEERRRLRRDLHDGVGAALAGARLQLDSARELVTDPLAGSMLDAASGAVVAAVDDVRRITEDLRPPALDEIGLAGSLASLADRMRTPALAVHVEVAPLPPLPAALEVACVRIAGEALANAARHASAARVGLRLDVDGDTVRLEVTDDGHGFEGARAGGIGLASMRQRAEELGGRLEVVSGTTGTTVRATVPWAAG